MTLAGPRVVVSNGFNRFTLADAAAELASRGMLERFITGAYPAGPLWRLACALGLDRHRKLARLARRGLDIAGAAIHPLWLPEIFDQLGGGLSVAGLRLYARLAAGRLPPAGAAEIYHYRSGFGLGSVAEAKRRGMVALCEHSIVHPRLVGHLSAHGGRLPPNGGRPEPDAFWRAVLADVEQADHVVVNSDFVRQTFLHQGFDPARVHVLYFGVDDQFFDLLSPRPPVPDGPMRLLFAGGLGPRKGWDVLAEALGRLDVPWRLDVAATVTPADRQRHGGLLADPRVTCHGVLPRAGFARLLSEAEVFVFPTLAEGSARVVFEALAAGCAVVTTPNAGSIVEDGRHGLLVPPGDPAALAEALRRMHGLGGGRAAMGAANAALIAERYRQSRYGDGLVALYRALLPSSRAT